MKLFMKYQTVMFFLIFIFFNKTEFKNFFSSSHLSFLFGDCIPLMTIVQIISMFTIN